MIANCCEALHLNWALIGGIALPGYGVTRTTLDLDVAISFQSEIDISNFLSELEKYNVKTAQVPNITHLVFVIFCLDVPDEAEIWLAPCDAFPWNDEIINRIRVIDQQPTIRILSPEDFITTKLARSDRSSIDLQDVLEILLAQENDIDWDYLFQRITSLKLNSDLQKILTLIKKHKPDYYIPID